MRKTVPHLAMHDLDLSELLWCLAAIMFGCLSWLFYVLCSTCIEALQTQQRLNW